MSPFDSHEEDDSDDDSSFENSGGGNLTETVRIPNGSSMLNFKSSQELRRAQREVLDS